MNNYEMFYIRGIQEQYMQLKALVGDGALVDKETIQETIDWLQWCIDKYGAGDNVIPDEHGRMQPKESST